MKSKLEGEVTTLRRMAAAPVQGDWRDGDEESGIRPRDTPLPQPTSAAFCLIVKDGANAGMTLAVDEGLCDAFATWALRTART